jgi:hypothetical protein
MDNISEQLFNQQYSSYVVGLIVSLLIIVVLVVVVVIQTKKLKDANQPKYGFLGKPLNVMFIASIMLAGFGIYYYAANQAPTEDVQVSADRQIDISITATPLGDGDDRYRLNAVVYVDGVKWGKESDIFDVYWTITGANFSITEVELGLSSQNEGGFTTNLESGLNSIKATVFVGKDKGEKTITIDI